MKYNTFRTLILGGLVLVAVGVGAWIVFKPAPQEPPPAPPAPVVIREVGPPPPSPVTPVTPPNLPTTTTPPSTPEPPGLRDVDREMLRLVKTATVQEKIKDATSGRPYKINMYSDDGKAWNRAKIDLNRNEKFDEKWTWKPTGDIERQVATKDDENYDQTWILLQSGWKQK